MTRTRAAAKRDNFENSERKVEIATRPTGSEISEEDFLGFELSVGESIPSSNKTPRTPPGNTSAREHFNWSNSLVSTGNLENNPNENNESSSFEDSNSGLSNDQVAPAAQKLNLVPQSREPHTVELALTGNALNQMTVTKLPPFNKNDPDLWFNQVERLFARSKVTSEKDKADVLIGAVDSEISTCVRCTVLKSPVPADVYTQIKKGILA